jgi:hypothetical protein
MKGNELDICERQHMHSSLGLLLAGEISVRSGERHTVIEAVKFWIVEITPIASIVDATWQFERPLVSVHPQVPITRAIVY